MNQIVKTVLIFCWGIVVLAGARAAIPTNLNQTQEEERYNLTEGRRAALSSKKADLPLYIYGDKSGRKPIYIASGYMGDINALTAIGSVTAEPLPGGTTEQRSPSLKITYSAKGREGWAGIYWQSPANNWGSIKGAGYDLRAAKRLTFWARGEKGGELISEFKIGGVGTWTGSPYPDSDFASVGPIKLAKQWKQYTIDLEGKNLSHIIGGFMFLIKRADNVRGATFYLDEVVYTGAEQ